MYGRLTQLGECLLDVEEVTGSSPVSSTNVKPQTKFRMGFYIEIRLRRVKQLRYEIFLTEYELGATVAPFVLPNLIVAILFFETVIYSFIF